MAKKPAEGIICPACKGQKTEVKDSRPGGLTDAIPGQRRRRECVACGHRFTTIELSGDDLFGLQKRLQLTDQIVGALRALEAT